tara:strand:+ start:198 stop:686 length:489 start_codon:yes stop_codon:yes gene_type:complete
MGRSFRSNARDYRELFNLGKLVGQSAALFLWYLIAIGLSIWGIVALASQDPDAMSPAAAGWLVPMLTAIVHLAVLHVGYNVVGPSFVAYPVWPETLFALFDTLVAMFLGLAWGGLAANSLVLLMITNAFLLLPYMLCCYKYFVLVSEIRSEKRSEKTGARLL